MLLGLFLSYRQAIELLTLLLLLLLLLLYRRIEKERKREMRDVYA